MPAAPIEWRADGVCEGAQCQLSPVGSHSFRLIGDHSRHVAPTILPRPGRSRSHHGLEAPAPSGRCARPTNSASHSGLNAEFLNPLSGADGAVSMSTTTVIPNPHDDAPQSSGRLRSQVFQCQRDACRRRRPPARQCRRPASPLFLSRTFGILPRDRSDRFRQSYEALAERVPRFRCAFTGCGRGWSTPSVARA
jgi:hypothetical protein